MRFSTVVAGFYIVSITLSIFIVAVSSEDIPDLCGSPGQKKHTKHTAPVVNSCNKFYQCDEGEVVVKECKLSTKYDSVTGKCVDLDGSEPAFCSEGSTILKNKLLASFFWLYIFIIAIVVVMMTDTTE